MKLVNYKRGYNNKFDCSIHGTIYMTQEQWAKAFVYLRDELKSVYGFQMFIEDCERKIETPQGYLINIRVTATEMLATHYKLDNYKKGNYQLHIK